MGWLAAPDRGNLYDLVLISLQMTIVCYSNTSSLCRSAGRPQGPDPPPPPAKPIATWDCGRTMHVWYKTQLGLVHGTSVV
ncbi:hypothetical protein FKM82_029676 [Ascaphus truei]